MLINKKLTFIKYLNSTNILISSIPQIKKVQKLNNQGLFESWDKITDAAGGELPFLYFENGQSYIVVSQLSLGQSYELNIGDSSILTSIDITKNKQVDIYKGSNYDISNITQIDKIYKVNAAGTAYSRWTKILWQAGAVQDFDYLEDNTVYLIISSSVPYTLWPPEDVNPNSYSIMTEDGYAITTEDGYLLVT